MKNTVGSKIAFVLLFCVMIVAQSSPVAAQHRSEGRSRGRTPVVANLPAERTQVRVGGREYFYARGLFYRTGPRGYVVTRGPIGARVRVLPPGFVTLQIGGGPFFSYYGTYYRFDRIHRDYVVVEPPPGAPTPLTMDRVTMADGRTIEGTYLGGTQSTVQIDVGGKVEDLSIDQILSIEFAPPSE